MSQLLDMLNSAKVISLDGGVLGEVLGIHITGGRLTLVIDSTLEDIVGDDDPERESKSIPDTTPNILKIGGERG